MRGRLCAGLLALLGALIAHAPAAAEPLVAPTVARTGRGYVLDCRQADRRHCMALLAGASGSVVAGLEALPQSLGRVTVQARDISADTAWRLLLDGAPLGYALSCGGASCQVWLAAVPPASARAAQAVKPVSRRVESSEEGN